MTQTRVPAEVFHPGEFVKEEIEERGWSQEDLASILGCTPRLVSEIISGKRSISTATARGLGETFATGAQFWLNLDSAYQLHRLERSQGRDPAIAKRAQLFSKAPVREMLRRGWIESSDNPEVLEQRILQFFNIPSLEEHPQLWGYAARKSESDTEVTPAQSAWLFRARQLSRALSVGAFNDTGFRKSLDLLRGCLEHPQEARHVPRILADAGIRLVVLEHLRGTKIDGACFWLDDSSPVIALSIRYDRIDCFWFTLIHELGHVKHRDGLEGRSRPLDERLVGSDRIRRSDKPQIERAADDFATTYLVNQDELSHFIARVGPLYSKVAIRAFAKRLSVHPGLVVGQLQYREEITWAHSREALVKVRDIVTQSALTDGWGFTAPAAV